MNHTKHVKEYKDKNKNYRMSYLYIQLQKKKSSIPLNISEIFFSSLVLIF